MLISQTYPRKYATAEDLAGKDLDLTIARVTLEQVGPVQKPVAFFFGAKKGIILSATLARQIAALHGDDTAGWHGRRVNLHTVPCRRMDGTRGLSIRARAPRDTTAAATIQPSAFSPQPSTATLRNPATRVTAIA